jgi:hypothetical protein
MSSVVIPITNGTFNEAFHEYKNENGIVRPSVTQILEGVGLTDLSSVPGDRLEHKRQLGNAVHYATAIEDRCKFFKGPELDWDTVHESTVPYLVAYERFCDEMEFVPEEIEQSGIFKVNGMEFGYTRDRVGRMKGLKHRCVLELKCSYREEPAWKYQLSAYEMTIPKAENEYVCRVAVQLKPDTTYKPFLYENPRDRDRFLWALALTHVKIEEGLEWNKSKREDV